MILRLTRATIRPNSEEAVFAILRHVGEGLGRPAGLLSLHFGRRMGEHGNELISFTVWADIETLRASMGATMEVAVFLPQLRPHLVDATVEHFETIADRFEELDGIGS